MPDDIPDDKKQAPPKASPAGQDTPSETGAELPAGTLFTDTTPRRSTWLRVRPFLLLIAGLAVFAALMAVRKPFLQNPLMGEEGYFAILAVNNDGKTITERTNFLCHVRIGGNALFDPASHPTPPYLFMTRVLRSLPNGGDFGQMAFEAKSRLARLRFFLCFTMGLLLLIAATLWSHWGSRFAPGITALLLIAFATSTPLLVAESIKPQIDGSYGILLAGVACFLLFASDRFSGIIPRFLFAFFGGAGAAMGKNEWGLALGAAFLVALVLYLLLLLSSKNRKKTRPAAILTMAAGVLLGLGAGSLFSYWLDPVNYKAGLALLSDFENRSAANGVQWADSFEKRLPGIWPLLLLGAVSLASALGNCRKLLRVHWGIFLIFLWGMALAAGFLISTWQGGGTRYFAMPLFVLVFYCTVSLSAIRVPRPLWCEQAALFLVGICLNAFILHRAHSHRISITEYAGNPIDDHTVLLLRYHEQFLNTGQPVVADQSFCYYFPDDDFVSNTLSPQDQQSMIERAIQYAP